MSRKRPDLAERNKITKRIHGMRQSSTYVVWRMMKQRCLNSNHDFWDRYGGRGIKVCDRWLTFKNFYEDMGARPAGMELDRIDNDGNYEPLNCRWTSRSVNCSNRGMRVEINGVTKTLVTWCKELDQDIGTVRARINRGWKVQDAILVHPTKANRGKYA